MRRLLGIDLGVTAESRACPTDETGAVLHERRFRIRRNELGALYDKAIERTRGSLRQGDRGHVR